MDSKKVDYSKILLSEVDKAYIAGFIDGEGYLGIKETNRKYKICSTKISITNTNKEVLDFLKSKIGYGKIRMQRKNSNKWKACYTYDLCSLQVVDLLSKIFNYLVSKKEHAIVLLGYSKLLTSQAKTPLENIEERRRLVSKLKRLNKKGPNGPDDIKKVGG